MAEQSSRRTVLVAVNSSEHSQRAFDWYYENLYRKDVEDVVLFYCQDPLKEPADPYTSRTPEWAKKVKKHLETDKREFEKIYTKMCDQKSLLADIKVEEHHKASEHICKVAQEINAAYIVVGKRRLGTIRRTLIGGVSDHVVAHATMPVVVVSVQH